MGAVYKAADVVLRRFVAIKLLHVAAAQNPSSVERFEREARSAAAIGHPNIIDILDFGRENGVPYLVMEYLRGRSLAHALHAEGPFSPARASSIASHSLAGLGAAHLRGILHRDLKPANLMLIARFGDQDFVKICDFGFAALLGPQPRIDSEGRSLTPARTLVGTPAYASPERLRGDDRRDPRVDVYAIGVVLYEMLAGRRPFDAPTFVELAKKVKNDPPPKLSLIRADLPPGLIDAVEKALAKKPEDRFESAEEFAAALVPYGGQTSGFDNMPSDSFTMDLLQIRAREKLHTQTGIAVSRPVAALANEAAAPQPALPTKLDKPPTTASTVGGEKTQKDGPPRPAAADATQRVAPLGPAELAKMAADAKVVAEASPQGPAEEPLGRDRTTMFARAGGSGGAPMVVPPTRVAAAKSPPAYAYNGAVVLPVLRMIAERYGERSLRELLAALPEDPRRVFRDGISASTWVEGGVVEELLVAIDKTLGADDLRVVVECGRAAAEGALETLSRGVSLTQSSPELLIGELPALIGELVRGLKLEVRRVGRGYARIEKSIPPQSSPTVTSCVNSLGFLERALLKAGAKEVEVNLLACLGLGDEHCLFDLSWLAQDNT